MYYLNEDVYLVVGIECASLYDSRNGAVYHLDREARDLLQGLLSDKLSNRLVQSKTLVQYLTSKHLLKEETTAWDGDINRLKKIQKITFAWIEISTTCNLKCIHCYEGDQLSKAAEMTWATFTQIVDELVSFGVRKIQLIGGEPLTCPSLKKFLDYTIGKFEYVEVYTNGTLIDQAWVDYFKRHKINVALSVYSYEAKWHEMVTGIPGSWQKTNIAIQTISDAGIKYRVRNVLIKDIQLGQKNTCLYTLNEDKDVVRMVGRANVKLLNDETIKKRLITKARFRSAIPKQRVSLMVNGHNCFSTHLYFDVYGTVYPCVMERRISHGNIHSGHLKDLLKTEITQFNKDHISGCKDCEFRYFCFDCRPDSLGGDITSKPWYCTYHPETGEWEDEEHFISSLHSHYQF